MRLTCCFVLALTCGVLPARGQALFQENFERGLDRWRLVAAKEFSLVDSGDPHHGKVLQMKANGSHVYALIRGSEKWNGARVEGEVLFPSDDDN